MSQGLCKSCSLRLCRSVLDIGSGVSGIACVAALRRNAWQYTYVSAAHQSLPAQLRMQLRDWCHTFPCERLRQASLTEVLKQQLGTAESSNCTDRGDLQRGQKCIRCMLLIRLDASSRWEAVRSMLHVFQDGLQPAHCVLLVSDDAQHTLLHTHCSRACARGTHLCVYSSQGDETHASTDLH